MRFIQMDDQIFDYITAHANPSGNPIADELHATTRERFGQSAGMNVGADQGAFLAMLVAISGSRTVVEVGTFTGMSALWMAGALPADGTLTCFDITDKYLPTAQEAWDKAGVSDRIEFRQGPAADNLAELPNEPHIDMAFIDADKGGYQTYVEQILPRLSDGGFIAVDNVLWSGRIIDADATDDNTVALREFNDWVAARDDIVAVMLPVGDGVTLIRRSN